MLAPIHTHTRRPKYKNATTCRCVKFTGDLQTLGTELGLSGLAASVLIHWAISPAPELFWIRLFYNVFLSKWWMRNQENNNNAKCHTGNWFQVLIKTGGYFRTEHRSAVSSPLACLDRAVTAISDTGPKLPGRYQWKATYCFQRKLYWFDIYLKF